MYKLTNNEIIIRLRDGAFIPMEVNNTDYQEYISWISQGNIAEPADPIPNSEPLTPEQKLQNAGLTVEELKSLLGLQ
jgi:hypothetical protein